jgi:tRNA threonylcarbamoyl adenosine modification protein YeaZ
MQTLADAGRSVDEITAVIAGTGPGPFTGLRIGLVTARTFAFARGIPVFGVCSLDAMAHQAWLEASDDLGRSLVVATDARRKEVYWAGYDVTPAGVLRRGAPMVAKAEAIADEVRGLPVAGRGAVLYADWFGPQVGPLDVSAGALADLAVRRLSAGEELAPADPMYLRRPDAMPLAPRKQVLP